MSISMSDFFKRDMTLDKLVARKNLHGVGKTLHDIADSSVTITYGGDGVMLPEIFDNGAALVKAAGKRPIWLAWDSEREQMFFFIGRLKTILAKVSKLAAADDDEDEDFTAGECDPG